MYYLWKGKTGIYYISDYKEIRPDGLVKIDNYGYIDVELIYSNKVKFNVIEYAQKHFEANNPIDNG